MFYNIYEYICIIIYNSIFLPFKRQIYLIVRMVIMAWLQFLRSFYFQNKIDRHLFSFSREVLENGFEPFFFGGKTSHLINCGRMEIAKTFTFSPFTPKGENSIQIRQTLRCPIRNFPSSGGNFWLKNETVDLNVSKKKCFFLNLLWIYNVGFI